MKLMGIGDEAGDALESQIAATLDLGWTEIEPRSVLVSGHSKANFHDLPDAAFEQAFRKFEDAGVRVHCFGSTIMNWSKRVDDPFEITLEEVGRAIPRMQRTGAKYVRIMSFKPGDDEFRIPNEVFKRVREVTNRFLDVGLQPVHENCMNFGGMSWQHALELLDKCPGLKWVFDTANPLFNTDRSKSKPWPIQDPLEFWEHVRGHVVHFHIKDAIPETGGKTPRYTWPAEGAARVLDIVKDAVARGYDGGFSIEPHMVSVFHEPGAQPVSQDPAKKKNYVDYGRRLVEVLKQAKKS